MKRKLILLLTICLLAVVSCSKTESGKKEALMEKDFAFEGMSVPGIPPPPPPSSGQGQYNPKRIKNGVLSITSSDIESTKTLVYEFVKKCSGYVVKENLVREDPGSYYEILLSIEASHFDRFLNMLDSSDLNIVSRSFSIEDVTLKFIDDSTRLDNKKKLLKRYLDLLSKTKDIKDIIEVEEKLEEIQTDIEVKEGQLKLLEKQVAFSELVLRIEKSTDNLTFDQRNKYTYKLGQAIIRGWLGVKELIIFFISLWPLYLLGAILFIWIIWIKRRRRK